MQSQPFKCPVYEGKGSVPKGFYPDKPKETECQACSGKGVIWGWSRDAPRYVPQPYPVPYPVYPRPICPPIPWTYPVTPTITCGTATTATGPVVSGGTMTLKAIN